MNALHATHKPGLITRILLAVITLALVVVGFFFLTVALIAGALIALVIGARVWWAIRKLKHAQSDSHIATGATGAADGSVVDGEYQVVERESSAQPLPPPEHSAPPHKDSDSSPRR
jgi:predicted lipid-binding transport protein (Tim44 family)